MAQSVLVALAQLCCVMAARNLDKNKFSLLTAIFDIQQNVLEGLEDGIYFLNEIILIISKFLASYFTIKNKRPFVLSSLKVLGNTEPVPVRHTLCCMSFFRPENLTNKKNKELR